MMPNVKVKGVEGVGLRIKILVGVLFWFGF